MNTKIKAPLLTGIYLQQYIQTILNTLKSVAFHQIYMENQRQLLCKNELYDPLTAFKSMDTIKHNKIVAYQLRSFIEHQGISSPKQKLNDLQCEEALNCLNKSLLVIGYEDFQQITLPNNISLRNITLARYNNIQIKIGTMTKIYEVKSTSARQIAKYFMKQIQFYRELLLRKQNFCQKYGGDLYTLSQALCKGKTTKFNYQQFYQFCRGYKFYFNQQQFIAIYKRTKSISHLSPLYYDNISQISIQIQSLSHLLITSTKNLDIKNKIRIVSGEPFDHVKQPSYKIQSIRLRQQNQKAEKQRNKIKNQVNQQIQKEKRDKRDIRFRFYYPQQHFIGQIDQSKKTIREMNHKWNQDVMKMGQQQINIRYRMIDKKHYFI